MTRRTRAFTCTVRSSCCNRRRDPQQQNCLLLSCYIRFLSLSLSIPSLALPPLLLLYFSLADISLFALQFVAGERWWPVMAGRPPSKMGDRFYLSDRFLSRFCLLACPKSELVACTMFLCVFLNDDDGLFLYPLPPPPPSFAFSSIVSLILFHPLRNTEKQKRKENKNKD